MEEILVNGWSKIQEGDFLEKNEWEFLPAVYAEFKGLTLTPI